MNEVIHDMIDEIVDRLQRGAKINDEELDRFKNKIIKEIAADMDMDIIID